MQYANGEAKRLGIADRASFRVQDVFKADLSRASVITLYLLPSMMLNLRHKLLTEARPGTRVVSHDYPLPNWKPVEVVEFDAPEKVAVSGTARTVLYLYRVPERR